MPDHILYLSEAAVAGASIPLDHMPRRGSECVESAVEVYAQYPVPFLGRHLQKRRGPAAADASIGKATVDAAQSSDGLRHRRIDRLFVADIALQS